MQTVIQLWCKLWVDYKSFSELLVVWCQFPVNIEQCLKYFPSLVTLWMDQEEFSSTGWVNNKILIALPTELRQVIIRVYQKFSSINNQVLEQEFLENEVRSLAIMEGFQKSTTMEFIWYVLPGVHCHVSRMSVNVHRWKYARLAYKQSVWGLQNKFLIQKIY